MAVETGLPLTRPSRQSQRKPEGWPEQRRAPGTTLARGSWLVDAAERRIRAGGYGGFSFRDLAADVGVKSASVHYHFPTKGALVAAVARRYNDRVAHAVEEKIAAGSTVVKAWREVFLGALAEGPAMCLCGSLGAISSELTPEVTDEVRRFFDHGVESLMTGGLTAKTPPGYSPPWRARSSSRALETISRSSMRRLPT